jgi:2-iminoacetate synthase ThiH
LPIEDHFPGWIGFNKDIDVQAGTPWDDMLELGKKMALQSSLEEKLNLDSIAQSVLDGGLMRPETAARLFGKLNTWSSGEGQLLKNAAHQLSTRLSGGTVTWTQELPLFFTNICEMQPSIYGYARLPDEETAYVLTIDDIEARLEEGMHRQATRLFLTGGMYSELCIPGLEAPTALKSYGKLVSHLRELVPSWKITGFSPDEIDFLSIVSGRAPRYILEYLMDAGLSQLGGYGADILVDRVRHLISPKKMRVKDWFGIMETAESLGLPVEMTMTYGHFETPAERAEHLSLVRAFAIRYNKAVTAFIPQPVPAATTRTMLQTPVLKVQERLLTTALIRLFLGESLPVLQVGWTADKEKIAKEEAQESLLGGANHLGSPAKVAMAWFLAGQNDAPFFTAEEWVEMTTGVQLQGLQSP